MVFIRELRSKKEILLHDDRYIRACESIGYEFDADGIDKKVEEGLGNNFTEQVSSVLNENIRLSENW